jgi:hypothetical protein
MGKAPKGLTLGRINNDAGYFPENCRWETRKQQAQNRRIRSDNNTGIHGVYWNSSLQRWAIKIDDVHLGYSTDFFEACCRRKAAELKRNKL